MTRDGFGPFFRERFSRIVIMLIVSGASQADAEDAAQEAMIQAWEQWEQWEQWEHIESPAAWVSTVAYRLYWRRVRHRGIQMVPLEGSPFDGAVDVDLDIFTEEQQHVLGLLRNLSLQQRTVIALFYDGLTCEEIAELLGKPPPTVRSHLRHARQALREMIATENA